MADNHRFRDNGTDTDTIRGALGNLAFALGVLDFVVDHAIRLSNLSYWQDYNPARGVAETALILSGLIAMYVAECLKNVEQRLSKLEEDVCRKE